MEYNHGNCILLYTLMIFWRWVVVLNSTFNLLPLPVITFFFFLKIIEACVISVITSVISFGLPLLRKCSPCPESDIDSGIECPRPPGMYGNYVNVRFILWKWSTFGNLVYDYFSLSFMIISLCLVTSRIQTWSYLFDGLILNIKVQLSPIKPTLIIVL